MPSLVWSQPEALRERSVSIVRDDVPAKADTWLGKDKAQHFMASFLLVSFGTVWHSDHHDNGPGQDVHFGMGLSLSLGIAKEFRDLSAPGGRFSWKDIVADVAGTVFGGLLLLLIR
jgi:uncharacterized protein YfiM (DUF2279 family)